ncbi:uncharacterized protein PG986_003610 [Apiospora aurea]|uniref:Myb-like DNA-binding domain-containing protein n=1 Tax=Apiospora aurea TaxID=335848 RepID=A0ABR1QSC7_9PEZI
MSDKSNKPSKSDADEVIKAMQEDIWLLVAIIDQNQMEERTKGWKEIAAKRGLSTDAAKQRYEKLKKLYKAAAEGVVPPKAIVKRRIRRSKQASLDDKDDGEEPDGGNDLAHTVPVPSVPLGPLAPPPPPLPASGTTQGTKRSKPADEESDDDDDEVIPATLSASAKRQMLSRRSTAKPNKKSGNNAQDDGEGLPSTQETPAGLVLPSLHMPIRRHFSIEVAQMDRDSQARSRWRQEQERQDRVMRQKLGLPTGEQDEEDEAALAAQHLALHGNDDDNEAESASKQKKKRTPVPKVADKPRKVAERLARQRNEDEEKGQEKYDDE